MPLFGPSNAERIAELRQALRERGESLDKLKSEPKSDAYRLMLEESEAIAAEIRRLKGGSGSGISGKILGGLTVVIGLGVASASPTPSTKLAGGAAVIIGILIFLTL